MPKATGPRQQTGTEAGQTVMSESPSQVPTLYVNHTGVETSLWDVRLTLGETIKVDRENKIVEVRELATVRMSPQHARVVAGLLVQQLENYERQFGRIPQPSKPAESESETRATTKRQG